MISIFPFFFIWKIIQYKHIFHFSELEKCSETLRNEHAFFLMFYWRRKTWKGKEKEKRKLFYVTKQGLSMTNLVHLIGGVW
jgi:hypothetical protein